MLWTKKGLIFLKPAAMLCCLGASFLAGANWGRRLPHLAHPASAQCLARPEPAAEDRAADAPPAQPSRTSQRLAANRVWGEFDPQAAVVMGCDELLPFHEGVFRDMVAALSGHVKLIGVVSTAEKRKEARRILERAGLSPEAVEFMQGPCGSMWIRDTGPQFSRRPDGTVGILNATIDADGGTQATAAADVAPRVLDTAAAEPVDLGAFRFQGGNLLGNGDGLCVSTSALLESNHLSGYDEFKIAWALGRHFGFRRWLRLRALVGEETQHVDMFVAFLAPNVAVVGQYDPQVDATNAQVLDEAAAALAGETTSLGPMQVYRVPMPPRTDGVWRTYTNILLANGVLAVPTYEGVDRKAQQAALDLYARLMPDWKVVGINADTSIRLGGALRCICLNLPQFVDPSWLFTPMPAQDRPAVGARPDDIVGEPLPQFEEEEQQVQTVPDD